MTIASAFAIQHVDLTMVAVFTDTRLSWKDGRRADIAVKAFGLAPRIAVVSAGRALVAAYAAELTRSIFYQEPNPQTPISLWDATRLFVHFAKEIQGSLRAPEALDGADPRVENEFVLAGYYADGTPGLSWIHASDNREAVEFWRPGATNFGTFSIGSSPAKDIVRAAYADFGVGKPIEDPSVAVMNAMYYAMSAEGTTFESVGGGLAAGFCTKRHAAFVWPSIEINRQRYYRGFPMQTFPEENQSSVLKVNVDTNYAALLDRRVADSKHNTVKERIARTYECSVKELLAIPAFRQTLEPAELRGAGLPVDLGRPAGAISKRAKKTDRHRRGR